MGRASHSTAESVSARRAPAISFGSGASDMAGASVCPVKCGTVWRLEWSVTRCERMVGPDSAASVRASSRRRASSFSAEKARTTPATELRSVMAMALSPSSAARVTSSSGCEEPVRKVKFDVTQSSA